MWILQRVPSVVIYPFYRYAVQQGGLAISHMWLLGRDTLQSAKCTPDFENLV